MILVVDDEPAVAMLIALALKRKGFRVLTAHNGADAIKVSQSNRGDIQLVITDITVAETDGPTMMKVIEEDAPSVPVLYTSDGGDVPESELIEGYDVLAKPFSIETLLADVGAMLAQTTSVS